MFRRLLIALLIAVTLGAAAAPAYAASGADQRLPTLEEFARSVVTGTPGQVVGVYVPEVLALRVVPQPERVTNYVDASPGTATQFQLPVPFGVTCLLARALHMHPADTALFGICSQHLRRQGELVRQIPGGRRWSACHVVWEAPEPPELAEPQRKTKLERGAFLFFGRHKAERDSGLYHTARVLPHQRFPALVRKTDHQMEMHPLSALPRHLLISAISSGVRVKCWTTSRCEISSGIASYS